jgi:S-adenosylmethionine:tRNA ribosyltransferase-isomerase
VNAATWPREDPLAERLLILDPRTRTWSDARMDALAPALHAGDLLVVNDAATAPASVAGIGPGGAPIEVRLAGENADGTFRAIVFGSGDWHQRTEDRPTIALREGDRLVFGAPSDASGAGELHATVLAFELGRLARLRFDEEGADLWRALYRHGRPIQYSYVARPLEPWHGQSRFASRPWAMEPPSAGRPLTFETLHALARRGVTVRPLTHAAGISSTGDPVTDALLPFPERYDVPARTVDAIHETKARGGRIVAVGTTVVRALEGAAANALRAGESVLLPAGEGVTDLRLCEGFPLRIVDGLLTGMHEPTTSHFDLLQAFADADLLRRSYADAERRGYLAHEFGDSTLIL